METKQFIPTGQQNPHNTNFSILLEDSVGEYELPHLIYGVTVRKIWDANTVQDILSLEHPITETEPLLIELTERFFKRIETSKFKTYLANIDKSTHSNYYQITFWCPEDFNWDKHISDYLNKLTDHVLAKWVKRGADDDYFDYLPSLTDMLFQLCQVFQANAIWDTFLDVLISKEPYVREGVLYRSDLNITI